MKLKKREKNHKDIVSAFYIFQMSFLSLALISKIDVFLILLTAFSRVLLDVFSANRSFSYKSSHFVLIIN